MSNSIGARVDRILQAMSPGAIARTGTPAWGQVAARARTPLVVVALLLAVFWLFRLVLPGDEFGIDVAYLHYPVYRWTAAQLLQGGLPLWNPYQLCGVPTLATLQGGLLYPPHLLYLVLPTHIAMALSSYLHLLLATGAMLIFALRAGLGWGPALLAAILLGMRGAQPGHIFNPSMLESGAWLCVGFVAALEIARGRLIIGAMGMSLATALCLFAGFPQFAIYSAYAWGFLTVGVLLFDRHGLRHILQRALTCVAAILLGALMASVQLLPALELAEHGARQRGQLPLELMYPFGLMGFGSAWNALQTVLLNRSAAPSLFMSFGLAALLLPLASVFHRKQRALAMAAIGLALITVAFALGPATPLFEHFLRLPELGSFRSPSRVLLVADFCFAITAAIGLDFMLKWRSRSEDEKRARFAGSLRIPLFVAVVAGAGFGSGLAPLPVAAACLVASLLAAVAFRRLAAGYFPAIASTVVLVAVVVEIFLAPGQRFELPYRAANDHVRAYEEPRPLLDGLANDPSRVWSWGRPDADHLPWKAPSLFGVRSLADYDIMLLERQAEYFSYLMWGRTTSVVQTDTGLRDFVFHGRLRLLGSGVDVPSVLERSRLSELAAARHLLVPRFALGTPPLADFLASEDIERQHVADPSLILFENRRALPRAYIAHGAQPAPPVEELMALMSRPDFDPRQSSFVEGTLAVQPVPVHERVERTQDVDARSAEPGDDASEFARIVVDDLHRVEIEARLASPGLLVLADSYYPGWRATIDGKPARIHATNHLFRGVALEAGRHRVVFDYQPQSVSQGAFASLAGLLGFAGMVFYWRLAPPQRDLHS